MSTHTIKRSKSGYWEVRYSEQRPDGTWRSKSVSTGTKDVGQAREFKDAFVANSARLSVSASKPKLEVILKSYEKAKPIQTFVLRAPLRLLGHLHLDLLTPDAVTDYVSSRTDEGIAGPTVRRELGAVVAAMNWAAKTRFAGVKREDVPFVAKPNEGTPRTLWLDTEAEAEFHALAMGLSAGRRELHRLSLFVGLGLDTAARREAIMDLTWDRVDLVRGKIDFRMPGKVTGRKRRTVVDVSKRLRPLLERAQREWRARGAQPMEAVVGAGSIRTAWEGWVGRVGFPYPWMTPHLMRHSWARLAARAGVSLFDIATVLGDRYETVAANYLHDCPGNTGVVDRRFG